MKIALIGASGRMGKYVLVEKKNYKNIKIIKKIDKNIEIIGKFDLILDFSHFSSFEKIYEYARNNPTPLLICTTGHDENQIENMKKLGEKMPVCLCPNTSIGIFLMKKLTVLAKSILPNYDVSIIERHHKNKKDAPSGTAKMLAKSIAFPEEKILSVRCGALAGTHEIEFIGEFDTLKIVHECISPALFAKNALSLCEKVVSLPNGFYDSIDNII